MAASHCALCGSTGRLAMGVFQTLSAGNIGQLGAPGNGVPADATAVSPPIVGPSHSIADVINAIATLRISRFTMSPFPPRRYRTSGPTSR